MSQCESKVDAKILADVSKVSEEVGVPILISFLQCPVCKEALISYQEMEQIGFINGKEEWDFGTPVRLWPDPEKNLHHSLPELVKASLQEAEKCYRAKAYYQVERK